MYSLLDLVFSLANRSNALVDDVLVELDLTHSLANLLWTLSPDEPPASMRVLAGILDLDPSTITFLVDRLEEKGLVTREVNPANRRVKNVLLTNAGRDARGRLVETMSTRAPIARLTAIEQRRLLALLAKAAGTPPPRPRQLDVARGDEADPPGTVDR